VPCSASSLAVCSDGGDIAGGAELAAPVGSGLQGAIEGGKREGRRRSSQRCRRGGQRARGGLVTTGGRRRSRWPEEEEDVGDGAPRLPASHGLVETKKEARRFFWRHRRGEGWPVAAANSVGGDGCARHERERETEEGGELGRE
jgi:hypothetical protein